MTPIDKTAEGERLVRERYLAFLEYWPVPNEHVRIATSQRETFVVACGDVSAAPLLLLHGSAGNSVMWIGDIFRYDCWCIWSTQEWGRASSAIT